MAARKDELFIDNNKNIKDMEIIKINRTITSRQKVLVINISNKESLGVYNDSTQNYIYSDNEKLLRFIHQNLLNKNWCCTLIEQHIYPPAGYGFTLEWSGVPRINIVMYKEIIDYSIEK